MVFPLVNGLILETNYKDPFPWILVYVKEFNHHHMTGRSPWIQTTAQESKFKDPWQNSAPVFTSNPEREISTFLGNWFCFKEVHCLHPQTFNENHPFWDVWPFLMCSVLRDNRHRPWFSSVWHLSRNMNNSPTIGLVIFSENKTYPTILTFLPSPHFYSQITYIDLFQFPNWNSLNIELKVGPD